MKVGMFIVPDEESRTKIQRSPGMKVMDAVKVYLLSHNGPEEFCAQADKILSTLTPREELALRLRLGIGCEPQSLKNVASEVGTRYEVELNPKRVKVLLAKAARKLRHPVRKKCWDRPPKQ